MATYPNESPGQRPASNDPDALSTAQLQEQQTSTLMEIKGALGIPVDRAVPMNPADIHRVDDLQDELMATGSPEGRPPSHELRMAEWRWLALGIAVLLAGGLVWAVTQGVDAWWIVLSGLLLICLLGIGAAPVLYAGMLRGGEERNARKTASAVVKGSAVINR